jgi:hypothetical protein
MLTRIYVGGLCVAAALLGFFTYYSWSWLNSIGSPAAAAAGYEYHADLSWTFLWITAVILLFVAKGILWTTGRLWPMWATFVFFAFFVIVRDFWLHPAYLTFRQDSGLGGAAVSARPILAAVLIVVAAAIVFFEQFILLRLKAKTYPDIPVDAEEIAAEDTELKATSPDPLEDRDSVIGRDDNI